MLFHASIAARDPAKAASVLAEMWQGRAYPFPPVPGSLIVLAGDERGSAIEIYPAGQVLVPGEVQAVPEPRPDGDRPSETHLAIGVGRSEADLHAIAARAGWMSRTCNRGGKFRVVEIWVENRILIEALTPEMQREYTAFATPGKWEALLREIGVPADHGETEARL